MNQSLMTVKDVAEYLKVNDQTVQRYVMHREIPFLKVKRMVRFRFDEIEKWVEENRNRQKGKPGEKKQEELFGAAGPEGKE